MRLPVGLVLAIFAALIASSVTASADVTSCAGLGVLSDSPDVSYGACSTDVADGDGSVTFSDDGTAMTLAANAKHGDEQVAGFWQSNGPVSVAVTRICIALDITELKVKHHATVQEQLVLSYNGAQQDPLTFSATRRGVQDPYCGDVPDGATNVFWQLLTLAGGPHKSWAQVTQTLVTVGYSD